MGDALNSAQCRSVGWGCKMYWLCTRMAECCTAVVPLAAQVQELNIHKLDASLLLPAVIEHNIDERSPLAGKTQKTLEVGLYGGMGVTMICVYMGDGA